MQSFPTSAVCFKLSEYHNVITLLLPAETGQMLGAEETSPFLRPKWPQLCLRAKVLSKTKPKRKKKRQSKCFNQSDFKNQLKRLRRPRTLKRAK